MSWRKRASAASALLLFVSMLATGCNLRMRVPQEPVRIQPRTAAELTVQVSPTVVPAAQEPASLPTAASDPLPLSPTQVIQVTAEPVSLPGEPAGCLRQGTQPLVSNEERLAYAADLLGMSDPLSRRFLPEFWNAYTRTYYTYTGDVLALEVEDVQNKHFIQKMMNALQVAGYVTWLREGRQSRQQILAIPLGSADWSNSVWTPYVQAYWQSAASLPAEDPSVIPVLKTPPCQWMVEQGLAPQLGADWLPAASAGWPNYAGAAAEYLADTNDASYAVARRIAWLGEEGHEGPDTMCGPLAWSILHDAGAFPPGWGAWMDGPGTFWLAMPRDNGRPWILFPNDTYQLYSFHVPMIKFDFDQFRLYPGDFLYTYSERVGFDHMLLITEVDDQGNVYSVTNLVQVKPQKKTTVERVLALSYTDPTAGIIRNQWAKDGTNGRTGHDGFDVFRWAWAQKDISGQAVKYTVKPGDTLPLIAASWRTPANEIARYNGIEESAALSVGQELQIPPNQITGVRE